jgi:hypothetical protein
VHDKGPVPFAGAALAVSSIRCGKKRGERIVTGFSGNCRIASPGLPRMLDCETSTLFGIGTSALLDLGTWVLLGVLPGEQAGGNDAMEFRLGAEVEEEADVECRTPEIVQ